MTKRESLIGYAISFTSFLLDSKVGKKIKKIILFGSVARGDFTEESDIDLFIDTKSNIENEVNRTFTLFTSSKTEEIWKLKGVKNNISLKVGELNKWKSKREIISSGLMLYGKYNELPEKTKYYAMIKIDVKEMKTAKQMKIWRRLYGYKQKVGKKVYEIEGLVNKSGGLKVGKAVFLIPMENRKNIIDFLKKNKVKHTINELWSDSF